MTARPFLVIGAMKSGTTTLESLLASHPEVSIPIEKETTAFDGSDAAHRAATRILNASTVVAGEVSTGYMQHPVVTSDPRQAAELLGPNLRVVAVLRDPFSRAVSHWRHWEQLGRNTDSLVGSLTDPGSAHVAFSRYHEQLTRWAEVLPDSHLLVLRLEDYQADPQTWQHSITDFLQIGPFPTQEMVVSNAADSRVVARGIGKRVSRSRAYRRIVRPLVPTAGRRLAARAMGGRKGGSAGAEAPSPDQELAFDSLVAEDARRLQSVWPHAHWSRERG